VNIFLSLLRAIKKGLTCKSSYAAAANQATFSKASLSPYSNPLPKQYPILLNELVLVGAFFTITCLQIKKQ